MCSVHSLAGQQQQQQQNELKRMSHGYEQPIDLVFCLEGGEGQAGRGGVDGVAPV